MSSQPTYTGEPTLGQVMRRPRWMLALIAALAVAAVFAGLAQWQMDHAVKLQEPEADSETVTPLVELTDAGEPVTDASGGRMVALEASLVPGDTVVVHNRMNAGELGAWVVAHFVSDGGGEHLAVALGWTPTAEKAQAAVDVVDRDPGLTSMHRVVGRYMPSDGPVVPGPGDRLDIIGSLSTAQLVNLWAPFEGRAFSGYLVAETAPQGLDVIDSVPPLPEETINWLNLFYAIEWLVFAGFAVFFWYRLARDAWEKEHELALLKRQAADDVSS